MRHKGRRRFRTKLLASCSTMRKVLSKNQKWETTTNDIVQVKNPTLTPFAEEKNFFLTKTVMQIHAEKKRGSREMGPGAQLSTFSGRRVGPQGPTVQNAKKRLQCTAHCTCTTFDQAFAQKINLSTHTKRDHVNETKSFSCTLCEKTFNSNANILIPPKWLVLAILRVQKIALQVPESKFWVHFSIQTSPQNPQKDTLVT